LRAFAAAGRCGSFRDAARALGVTPSAVSHQVKVLEAWVGAPLFERCVRQVHLTAEGQRLSRDLNAAFAQIEAALAATREATAPQELRIAALPLFVSTWLAPRLPRFEAAFPSLSLRIDTDARVVDVANGEADIAIRNVPAPTPGLHARKLIDLRATPMCTPDLAATLRTPQDLAHATLIALNVGRAGWAEWLAGAGAPGLKPKRTLTVDSVPAAIDAAASGRGVMLGLLPLIWDAQAARALVAPFDTPLHEAGAYYAVCRKEARAYPVVAAFMDWLVTEVRADKPRLARLQRERLARR
jgi:LysR family glycine cleavage system transcriptional activator